MYNRYGRRDNKYKARIKILVHELGADEYTRQVEEEFAHMSDARARAADRRARRASRAIFADPAFESGLSDEIDRSDPDFAVWLDQNTHAHKQPGYAIATISLKPIGRHPRRCQRRPDRG